MLTKGHYKIRKITAIMSYIQSTYNYGLDQIIAPTGVSKYYSQSISDYLAISFLSHVNPAFAGQRKIIHSLPSSRSFFPSFLPNANFMALETTLLLLPFESDCDIIANNIPSPVAEDVNHII